MAGIQQLTIVFSTICSLSSVPPVCGAIFASYKFRQAGFKPVFKKENENVESILTGLGDDGWICPVSVF